MSRAGARPRRAASQPKEPEHKPNCPWHPSNRRNHGGEIRQYVCLCNSTWDRATHDPGGRLRPLRDTVHG